jgi:glycosyltransferase involved in cell wall biosynthesis
VRRGRVAGTDLLPRFAAAAPIDVFGMQVGLLAKAPWFSCRRVGLYGDVPQRRLHDQVALRRAYIHPYRWTSLGLALLEAMHLGMPVVCLATTEAHDAVPPAAGFVSNDVGVLTGGLRWLMAEPEAAAQMGLAARTHALRRFGLDRFLTEWNVLLEEVTA